MSMMLLWGHTLSVIQSFAITGISSYSGVRKILLSGFLNESLLWQVNRLCFTGSLPRKVRVRLYFPPFLPPTPGNTKWQEESLPNHYPAGSPLVKARESNPSKSWAELRQRFNGGSKASLPFEKTRIEAFASSPMKFGLTWPLTAPPFLCLGISEIVIITIHLQCYQFNRKSQKENWAFSV